MSLSSPFQSDSIPGRGDEDSRYEVKAQCEQLELLRLLVEQAETLQGSLRADAFDDVPPVSTINLCDQSRINQFSEKVLAQLQVFEKQQLDAQGLLKTPDHQPDLPILLRSDGQKEFAQKLEILEHEYSQQCERLAEIIVGLGGCPVAEDIVTESASRLAQTIFKLHEDYTRLQSAMEDREARRHVYNEDQFGTPPPDLEM